MYIVSYDIENDRIRNKVAKTLENYGTRVQYSVFECDISQKLYEKLYSELLMLMEDEVTGNIRFYQLCKNCEKKTATIGVKDTESFDEIDAIFI